MRIEFPKRLNFTLYYVHNRRHDGQIVLVWPRGRNYAFTFHDEPAAFLRDHIFVPRRQSRGLSFLEDCRQEQRRETSETVSLFEESYRVIAVHPEWPDSYAAAIRKQ